MLVYFGYPRAHEHDAERALRAGLKLAGSMHRMRARPDMIVVRFADDLAVGFEHEGDARRFLDAMRERLGEFALSLHPNKTRLIEFGRKW